ncbi:hypothetical protein BJY52DRAFT_1365554 [Lactarius psammicola]|nr:hypothetical protein BJY52DRAFT_1365554 [Lactarius psammicola]
MYEPNAGLGTGDGRYPPRSAQSQELHGVSNFVDGSGPIFSMYSEMAAEEDKKMAEGWKADADGILIFTGLFSAAVASLISVSIQDIRPNPQDTSNFYLANIYQSVSDPNRSNTPSSLPSPPTFSPPNYAVWVNSLWFLSLVISLTCALLATLLQQWARRYLRVTQPRYSPHKRARIRTFFAEGVEKFLLPWAVEALPTLLHVSLFLFFSGLVVFLCNVNLTIFKLVLSWVGVCTTLYGCITFIPIFRHDSPYYTPLSLPVWHIVTGISFIIFRALRRLAYLDYFSDGIYHHFFRLEKSYRKLLVQGMLKTAEETALNSLSGIDTRVFLWTFDSLDEDHELERFFSGLPGFRNSKVVDDPLPSLTVGQKEKLSMALMGLLGRTFSSDLLPEPVKNRRAVIVAKAIDRSTHTAFGVIDSILSRYQYRGPISAEVVQIVRRWDSSKDEDGFWDAQATISMIVARVRPHDDSWFILASNALGAPESVLRDYATHGDNLSLAILIHITRQQFRHYWKWSWPTHGFSEVLEAASKFNVQDTSRELRHDFCALWNHIVLQAQNGDNETTARYILGPIRNVYITLHQDASSAPTRFSTSTSDLALILSQPSSYPLCNVPGHHLGSTAHIHDDSASTTFARTVLHDNAVLAPASLVSPVVPSPFVPPSRHVGESLTDVPPLDIDICAPESFPSAHQTAIKNFRNPVTSRDPITARVTQGSVDTSSITIPHSTLEPLSSTPFASIASTSPPGVVAVQHIADYRTSSDILDIPSLPSPNPVLNDMLPTESHSSPLTPADAPGPSHPSPRLSSAPDLGDGAEGEGSAKSEFRKERDALDPPLAIRENVMATPNLLPHLVTDVAIASDNAWCQLVESVTILLLPTLGDVPSSKRF